MQLYSNIMMIWCNCIQTLWLYDAIWHSSAYNMRTWSVLPGKGTRRIFKGMHIAQVLPGADAQVLSQEEGGLEKKFSLNQGHQAQIFLDFSAGHLYLPDRPFAIILHPNDRII